MKGQIILCISTFTVLLASVNCQFPGQYPAPGQFSPYDAQGYGGGGFGGDTQQVDPFLVSFKMARVNVQNFRVF